MYCRLPTATIRLMHRMSAARVSVTKNTVLVSFTPNSGLSALSTYGREVKQCSAV